MTADRLLTPADVAARLSVSQKTLMEHVKSGALPFIDMVMVASDDMLFWKSPVASECMTMVKSGVAQFMSMTM